MILTRNKHKLIYMIDGRQLEYTHFSSSHLKEEDLLKIVAKSWKIDIDKIVVINFIRE